MLIFNHTCAKWRGGEWGSLWGCHSNFQQLCGCMAVFIFYNFVMIFCEVLSGTSTWFFRYSQIFSKIPKIREKFKKPTQPSQNYRSENVITQLIAKKNKAMCRWFLLLNSKKNTYLHMYDFYDFLNPGYIMSKEKLVSLNLPFCSIFPLNLRTVKSSTYKLWCK